MKSIIITPDNKKDFELAFELLKEFGKDRKRLSLDDDEDIGFAFLMKDKESMKEVADKPVAKKSAR